MPDETNYQIGKAYKTDGVVVVTTIAPAAPNSPVVSDESEAAASPPVSHATPQAPVLHNYLETLATTNEPRHQIGKAYKDDGVVVVTAVAPAAPNSRAVSDESEAAAASLIFHATPQVSTLYPQAGIDSPSAVAPPTPTSNGRVTEQHMATGQPPAAIPPQAAGWADHSSIEVPLVPDNRPKTGRSSGFVGKH